MEFFSFCFFGYEMNIIDEALIDTYCKLKDPNHPVLFKTHPIVHQQMYS